LYNGCTEVVTTDNIILALTAEVPFHRTTGTGNENNPQIVHFTNIQLHRRTTRPPNGG